MLFLGGNDKSTRWLAGAGLPGGFKASTRARACGTLVLREGFETSSRVRSLATDTCTVTARGISLLCFFSRCLWFCLMLWTGNPVDKADGADGLTDRQMDRQAGGAPVSAPAVCELSSSCLSVLTTLNAFSARIACSLSRDKGSGRKGKKG